MDDTVRPPGASEHQQILALIRDRVEIIGLDGRVRSTNAASDAFFAPASTALQGEDWLARWAPDQRALVAPALAAAARGAVERLVVEQAPAPGLQRLCWALSLCPLRDADGTVTAVGAVARDITDQRQAEQVLASLNAALRTDVLVLTDAAAEERAHARALQRKLSRVTASHRQSREESIGLHDRLLRAGDDAALGARREQALQDQLELATSAQHVAEQASLQAQKRAAIGQLVAGIAHDFNNMLQVVQMTLDMMALKADADPRQARLLERSREAVGHAVALAGRLLAFGRERPYRAEVLELGQVVEQMLPLVGHGLGTGMALELSPAATPLPVRSDRQSIEQALMNLCVNARDACQGHGRIDIALGWQDVAPEQASALQRAGRYACVEVRDDGRGMDAQTRARIFEPFFTTKPEGEGTGLGMAQVFGLMRHSEGFVTVDSAPGQGTTVRLCFPAIEAE